MTIKRKIQRGVNRLKALGAIYREIWRMAKKRKMVLVKPTPEENRQFGKALTAIEKRYGLSSSEARSIMSDAKRRVKRDMK